MSKTEIFKTRLSLSFETVGGPTVVCHCGRAKKPRWRMPVASNPPAIGGMWLVSPFKSVVGAYPWARNTPPSFATAVGSYRQLNRRVRGGGGL
jgi:hypothetical protein